MIIDIANEYTKSPGGRFITEGEYSGEDFRERILLPAFLECQKTGEKLKIKLDGGYGYGSSFLEESFGGLARKTNDPKVLEIIIISDEEPKLVDDIVEYMKHGLKNYH